MRVGWLGLLLLLACDSDDDLSDLCVDPPVLTWDNFGQDYVRHNCQTCHASTTVDRHDAPVEVVFDTRDQVVLYRDRILDRATGPTADMPPSGGVTEDDRWRAEVWLRCFED